MAPTGRTISRIVESAARIGGSAILDAEVVWIGTDGVADFEALHSRMNDESAVALAFDLLSLDGDDFRRKPFSERKAALRKVLKRTKRGIQYVEHTEGDGREMFQAVCKLGLEGIVSKKLDAPYRSGPSKTWVKVKNSKAPAPLGLSMVRSNECKGSCCRFADRRRVRLRTGSKSECGEGDQG
jgi:ATP-dependent DNA ligase